MKPGLLFISNPFWETLAFVLEILSALISCVLFVVQTFDQAFPTG